MSNPVAVALGIGATLIVGGLPFLFSAQQAIGLAMIGAGIVALVVSLVLWRRGKVRFSWTERDQPDGSHYRSRVRVTVPEPGLARLRLSIRGTTIQRATIHPVLPVGILSIGRTVRADVAMLTVQQAAGAYDVQVWTEAPERLTIAAK